MIHSIFGESKELLECNILQYVFHRLTSRIKRIVVVVIAFVVQVCNEQQRWKCRSRWLVTIVVMLVMASLMVNVEEMLIIVDSGGMLGGRGDTNDFSREGVWA